MQRLKLNPTNSLVGLNKCLYWKPRETKQQKPVNGVQEKEQNQIHQFAEQAVGALSSGCQMGYKFSRAPVNITTAEIICYSCWGSSLSCNTWPRLLYWAEITVGRRGGRYIASIWFSLEWGQYSWPRSSVLFWVAFLFFKGVLRVCRHNSRGFELLIL